MAKIKREKGELREMASQAKMRLKLGYWQKMKDERESARAEAESEGKSGESVDILYRSKITRDIKKVEPQTNGSDDELYKKVCSILDDNEDILNPIGRLIDKQKYDSMDSKSKQRYIMMLAAKYQELSERYHNEKGGIV